MSKEKNQIPTRKNFRPTTKTFWTHEVPTRKKFGPTMNPLEEILDPREKLVDPRIIIIIIVHLFQFSVANST